MKFTAYATAAMLALSSPITFAITEDETAIKETKMNYPINVIAQNYTDSEGVLLQGFLSTPNTTTTTTDDDDAKNVLPAVVILHDSSGIDAYEKQRATMIATELGYVAFAADIFGVETDIPVDTGGWGGPYAQFIGSFTGNATLFTQRIVAAVDHVQSLPYVNETKVAIVGYCLGGTGIVHYINVAGGKEGGAAAVVGVHPSLLGSWGKPVGNIHIPSLFLTGGSDFLTGPQAMTSLEDDMNSASTVEWETNRYSDIDHAFSNWFSENYNARADERSWNSLKTFLGEKFGQSSYDSFHFLGTGDCCLGVSTDTYMNNGENNTVAKPSNVYDWDELVYRKVPVVIILPDNSESGKRFAFQRGIQIAKRYGYAAWIAKGGDAPTREYLEVARYIDSDKVVLEGYGSSTQDALNIAMGGTGAGKTGDLIKAISIFQVPENITAAAEVDAASMTYKPQILISSGVDGDAMSTIVELEGMLMGMDANYEINRYSNASANFPNWHDESFNQYAGGRSFETIESIYREMFGEFPNDIPSQTEAPTPVPSFMFPTFAPSSTMPPTSAPSSGARGFEVMTASSCAILAVVIMLLM